MTLLLVISSISCLPADSVHLSPAPRLRRVREPENSGGIRRQVTLLDPPAPGRDVSVFIEVSLDKQIGDAKLKQIKDKTELPIDPA